VIDEQQGKVERDLPRAIVFVDYQNVYRSARDA
jgi:hypothetical protein